MSNIVDKNKIKQIDYETLLPFQSYISFNLTHRPKPIVQTSLLTKTTRPEGDLITKESREKYRKTKPRVCMPYQICVDNLDPEAYEFYVGQIYCGKNDKSPNESKAIAYTDIHESPDPVRYKTKTFFEDNRTYEKRERSYEDKKRKLEIKKKSCIKDVTPNISEEVKKLVKSDKVRWTFDKLKPGYAGYRPNCGGQSPLAKKEFYEIDQCVTTLQVMQNNYRKF